MCLAKEPIIPLSRPRFTSAAMYIRMLLWSNARSIQSLADVLGIGHLYRNVTSISSMHDSELFTIVSERKMAEIIQSAMDETGVLQDFMKDVSTVLGPFGKYIDVNSRYILHPRLRVCPECIESARHYIFHQLAFMDECPVCGEKLMATCPHCGGETPRLPYIQRNEEALVCQGCGESFMRYELPEEMFASFCDSNEIDFDIPKHSENILILSTDPLDENPYEQMALNKFLKGFYLNGNKADPDISLKKSLLNESGEIDIAKKSYELIDRVMGTDVCTQYCDNKRKCYNAIKKNLYCNCANQESFEAQAAMKLFEKCLMGEKETYRLQGYYLRRSFEKLGKQAKRANLNDKHEYGILNSIADDWVRRIYEYSVGYLKERNPYGYVQMTNENIPTPHFIYVIIETAKQFDIVILPSDKSYSMSGDPVKRSKPKIETGRIHGFYRNQKYGDISSRIVRV